MFQIISLLLSSIIGDPIALIASGPTYPSDPTPSHCIEILKVAMFLYTAGSTEINLN